MFMKYDLIDLIFLSRDVYKYKPKTLSPRRLLCLLDPKVPVSWRGGQISRLNLRLEFTQSNSPLPNRVKFIPQLFEQLWQWGRR